MPHITLPLANGGAAPHAPLALHYQDVGQGRPVVLIHGWPLSLRTWEPQVGALVAAGYRVIAFDRRGFGQSSQPWDGYCYDHFAQDLDGLLTALDVRNAALVGFSMGGGEVARYVGRHGSARVAAAVFAAAVPPFLLKTADNPDGGLSDEDIRSQQDEVLQDRLEFLEGFTEKFFTPQGGALQVSEAQRAYATMIAAMASPKGTHDCIAAFGRTDFRKDLEKFQLPTLVLHGDSDQIVPFEVSGQRTHRSIAGSQLHLIQGGPHGCNLSHAQEFNQALLQFLGGLPPVPAAR